MRWLERIIAVLWLLLIAVAPAGAHADFVSMSPAPGSVLATAPAEVTLRFSEDVTAMGSTIVIIDPTGRAVSLGDPRVQGPAITVDVRDWGAAGTYHVNFRVLSVDGHIVTDSRTFDFVPEGSGSTTDPYTEQDMATAAPEVSPIERVSPTAGYWITGLLMAVLALVVVGLGRVSRGRR